MVPGIVQQGGKLQGGIAQGGDHEHYRQLPYAPADLEKLAGSSLGYDHRSLNGMHVQVSHGDSPSDQDAGRVTTRGLSDKPMHIRCIKKEPLRALLQILQYRRWLYHLLNPIAAQTTHAHLDRLGRAINEGLDVGKIGSEFALHGHADMLTYTTLLLELSFPGHAAAGNRAFSANITSPCHDYIHLVLDNQSQWIPARSAQGRTCR